MTWDDVAFWLTLALGLAAVAAHVVALWQIIAAEQVSGLERIAWGAGVLTLPVVGVCAWFLVGRARDRTSPARVDAIADVLLGRTRGVAR